MQEILTISDYLRTFSMEIGEQVVSRFPPLHQPGDPVSPHLKRLKRRPFPGQELAIMGIVKAWEKQASAMALAECGTGKTLIALASIYAHAEGRPFTAIAMVPPQLVLKWARECFLTIPGVRVFLIDGVRNGVGSNGYSGVNEVCFRNGQVRRDGFKTTLSDLRLAKGHRSARERWRRICPGPAVLIISRERAKLGWFWRHAYRVSRSGPYSGCVVNPDTGKPILTSDDQLRAPDFNKAKHAEVVMPDPEAPEKSRRTFFSALWQADAKKIRRAAPVDFIGRHLRGFFDYAIADEMHELANDTAQGQALGTLASCARRTLALTGTFSGGYADEAFNNLFRLYPQKMLASGFEFSQSGLRSFAEAYGVLEHITTIEPADNACSEARVTKQVKRRPGASPLLFGHFLMDSAAFLSLEDIAEALPPYEEDVLTVRMDPQLENAYRALEDDIKHALEEYGKSQSLLSVGMNALLLYPDRPFDMGDLTAFVHDPDTGERQKILISRPEDLDRSVYYAKERRLIEEVRRELAQRRLCQIFAVYTKKRDVTQRLRDLLEREGIRAEVLTTQIPPERREVWYEEKLKHGMQVCIAHPRLVMTGLDILAMPTILFYETGYSTHVLRQASRRSWRIGQKQAVRVCYMSYSGTAQERCLRLTGKKMLVSLALEGKLANHGLTAMEDDEDVLTALARELVTEKGIGECAAAVWKTLKQGHTNTALGHHLANAETSGPGSPEAPVFVPEIFETRPTTSGDKFEQLSFCF
ncbi:MAG TPA: helicase-related protein [Bryobacteraceae bacterium]|nr:helicase-related protein [Bryobacteraceae bacterium]